VKQQHELQLLCFVLVAFFLLTATTASLVASVVMSAQDTLGPHALWTAARMSSMSLSADGRSVWLGTSFCSLLAPDRSTDASQP
jgi:hypothetical protein